MASGGKRGGAGERVLESRHVIGLFMLMLLFSGVFFTLGYVMGRNQIDNPVNAATDFFKKPEIPFSQEGRELKRAGNPAPTAPPRTPPAAEFGLGVFRLLEEVGGGVHGVIDLVAPHDVTEREKYAGKQQHQHEQAR